jgi:hypothetical protein
VDRVTLLRRLPNNDSRPHAIKRAASSVNWRTGGAANHFLQRLRRTTGRNRDQHTAHTRAAARER